MKNFVIVILFFVLATACGRKDNGFVPERLLSQTEMIDILTDVQLIEADLNYRRTQERDTDTVSIDYRSLTQSYYSQLFGHYGITDSIFSQNMRYYTEHPAELEKVMDSVTQRLLKVQNELKKEEND